MTETVSPINIYKPVFKSNNVSENPVMPKSPQDKIELENKNQTKNINKSFLNRNVIDIAAFATGIVGIGFTLKMNKANKTINKKAVSILESVGVKNSSIKSYFKRNLANLEQIENVLVKDKLTGLFNRRYLDEYFKKAFTKAKKDGTELHVFMFDIDRFKMVNSALGHDGGDSVLRNSSAAISKIVDEYKSRGTKMLFARYGGEEFTLVMEGVPKDKAIEAAQKIRNSVNQNKDLKKHANNFAGFFNEAANSLRAKKNLSQEEKFLLNDYDFLHNHVKKNNGFTISCGLCSLKEHNEIIDAPHEAVKLADLALENAKNLGRNRLSEAGSNELAQYTTYKIKDAFERRIKIPVEERAKLSSIIAKQIKTLKTKPNQEEKIEHLKETLGMILSSTYVLGMK